MKILPIFFLFITVVVFGETSQPVGFISFKPSYFYPQDKSFRHLYKGGYLSLAGLGFMLPKRFFLSVEAGYFHKSKRMSSFDLNFESSITLVPTSLYLGYIFAQGSFWELYAKVGPNAVYAKTHVFIPGMPSNKREWTFGGSFSLGSKFYVYKGLFVEMFLNYLYDKKEINDHGDRFSVFVGGLQAGGALGYRF